MLKDTQVICRRTNAPSDHNVNWNKWDIKAKYNIVSLMWEIQSIYKEQNKKYIIGNRMINPSQMWRGLRDGGRGREGNRRQWEKNSVCQVQVLTPHKCALTKKLK